MAQALTLEGKGIFGGKNREFFSPKIGDCFLFQAGRRLYMQPPYGPCSDASSVASGSRAQSYPRGGRGASVYLHFVPTRPAQAPCPGTNCALLISSKGRPCREGLCGCCPGHSRYRGRVARTTIAARLSRSKRCLLEVLDEPGRGHPRPPDRILIDRLAHGLRGAVLGTL